MISFEFHLKNRHEKTQKPLWFLGFQPRYLFRCYLLVIECMAEVRATPENTLKILHFYGIDARVYYEKVIRLCIAQGRICLLVIRYSEIVQILLKSVLCR